MTTMVVKVRDRHGCPKTPSPESLSNRPAMNARWPYPMATHAWASRSHRDRDSTHLPVEQSSMSATSLARGAGQWPDLGCYWTPHFHAKWGPPPDRQPSRKKLGESYSAMGRERSPRPQDNGRCLADQRERLTRPGGTS